MYQETVHEDVRSLLFDHQDFFQPATSNIMDIRKALEWLEAFLLRYEGFNLPNGLMGIHRTRKMAFQRLGDPDRMALEEAEIEKLEKVVPERLGALVGVRRSKPSLGLPAKLGGDVDAELRFALDIEEDNFFMDWYGAAGNKSQTRLRALQKLLDYMIMDLDDGLVAMDLRIVTRISIH